MTNSTGCCQIGKMVLGVVIFAIAIQLFFCLIAIAVAAGNGLLPIIAFSHMLSWPIYFISLALAVLLGIVRCLKGCCKSQACCSKTKECSTQSQACSIPSQSCCPRPEEK